MARCIIWFTQEDPPLLKLSGLAKGLCEANGSPGSKVMGLLLQAATRFRVKQILLAQGTRELIETWRARSPSPCKYIYYYGPQKDMQFRRNPTCAPGIKYQVKRQAKQQLCRSFASRFPPQPISFHRV